MSESEHRIATVRPVEDREATGKVAAIFAAIKKTKNLNFVPAFWRVIAINPAQLELVSAPDAGGGDWPPGSPPRPLGHTA